MVCVSLLPLTAAARPFGYVSPSAIFSIVAEHSATDKRVTLDGNLNLDTVPTTSSPSPDSDPSFRFWVTPVCLCFLLPYPPSDGLPTNLQSLAHSSSCTHTPILALDLFLKCFWIHKVKGFSDGHPWTVKLSSDWWPQWESSNSSKWEDILQCPFLLLVTHIKQFIRSYWFYFHRCSQLIPSFAMLLSNDHTGSYHSGYAIYHLFFQVYCFTLSNSLPALVL